MNNFNSFKTTTSLLILFALTPHLMAQNGDAEGLEGMSDPLAVYTRIGLGIIKDALEDDGTVMSYTLTLRSNIRHFANWSQYTDFNNGTHRIEYNHQF